MKARIIANYLPQFHPIPENEKYWGKGFTEWTSVAQAKPLFRGHYQPHIPADLGFYDLRLPESRAMQAELAKEAGIEGFCYWHYWFGRGRQLLQMPFQEVVRTGKPDLPFCLCWANHDWTTKSWKKGAKDGLIAQQEYLGVEDYTLHFNSLLPAFKDKRYITIDGKPIFVIYDPYRFTDIRNFIETWRKLAEQNGLVDFYFIAMCNNTTTMKRDLDGKITRVLPNLQSSEEVYSDILKLGFDGINSMGKSRAEMIYSNKYKRIISLFLHEKLSFLPAQCYDFPKVVKHFFAPEDNWENVYPTILAGWDRSPRIGKKDGIYINFTPENFQKHIEQALEVIKEKNNQHKILFLRSWNEWGEGNYVEPDLKYGHGYLDAISNALNKME